MPSPKLPLAVVCGSNKVRIIDLSGAKIKTVWEWQASDDPSLATLHFQKMDECKPINNGKQILVTSSTGGCALLDTASKKALFSTYLPNAHSMELLFEDYVAVIGSSKPGGDRMIIYNWREGKQLWEDSIFSGHGLAWVPEKSALYALGQLELRKYHLSNTEGISLKQDTCYELPSKGGHDLIWLPSKQSLVISASKNVWEFDLKTEKFAPHPLLHKSHKVKSISFYRDKLLYVQAEESWWAHHIKLFNGPDIPVSDLRVYKARWIYSHR